MPTTALTTAVKDLREGSRVVAADGNEVWTLTTPSSDGSPAIFQTQEHGETVSIEPGTKMILVFKLADLELGELFKVLHGDSKVYLAGDLTKGARQVRRSIQGGGKWSENWYNLHTDVFGMKRSTNVILVA
ncbi:MAG: hypothetical protein WD231_00625 [Candidatus Woykebacteria bacterium]